jgi:hypothetical protein
MGFGLGSFIWTTLGKNLLSPLATNPYSNQPWAVFEVQGVFAAIFFFGVLVSLPFLREPPPGFHPDTLKFMREQSLRGSLVRMFASVPVNATKEKFTFLQACRTQEMLLLCVVFFCAEIVGLVFLSSASDMVTNTFGLSTTDGALITSYLNLVNFAGEAPCASERTRARACWSATLPPPPRRPRRLGFRL